MRTWKPILNYPYNLYVQNGICFQSSVSLIPPYRWAPFPPSFLRPHTFRSWLEYDPVHVTSHVCQQLHTRRAHKTRYPPWLYIWHNMGPRIWISPRPESEKRQIFTWHGKCIQFHFGEDGGTSGGFLGVDDGWCGGGGGVGGLGGLRAESGRQHHHLRPSLCCSTREMASTKKALDEHSSVHRLVVHCPNRTNE